MRLQVPCRCGGVFAVRSKLGECSLWICTRCGQGPFEDDRGCKHPQIKRERDVALKHCKTALYALVWAGLNLITGDDRDDVHAGVDEVIGDLCRLLKMKRPNLEGG